MKHFLTRWSKKTFSVLLFNDLQEPLSSMTRLLGIRLRLYRKIKGKKSGGGRITVRCGVTAVMWGREASESRSRHGTTANGPLVDSQAQAQASCPVLDRALEKWIPYSSWVFGSFIWNEIFLFFFLFSFFSIFFWSVFSTILPLFGVEYWDSVVEWSIEWSFWKSSRSFKMANQ